MFSTPPWGRNECLTNAPQKDVCREAMVQTAQVKRRSVICSSTDAFLCPESETLIYCQPRFTDTGYLHTVYFHCHNYVIIVDIVPCSNNDSFLRVNKFLLQYCTKKKQYQSSVTYLILNNLSFVRCLTLVLRIVL